MVPVHIKGTGRLLPRGAKRPYIGSTEVMFGTPIAPDLPARQLVGRLEAAIAALADEATSDWWSARRRAAKGSTPSLTGPRHRRGAGRGRLAHPPKTGHGHGRRRTRSAGLRTPEAPFLFRAPRLR